VNFSVLISVYNKENASKFHTALESIFNQSLLPNEVVIVEDGPLSPDLYSVIKKFKNSNSKINLICVPLKKNVGLGSALNEGLKHCKFEWIARMDSDDISLKNRFKKTVDFIYSSNFKFDVVGSDIIEFDDDSGEDLCVRKVKKSHIQIKYDIRNRNPMNHVSVFFNKKSVINSGGYKSFLYFEDYFLWARMLLKGYKFQNINCSLVRVRAGKNMISRRRGYFYSKQEFLMQKFLLVNNLSSTLKFIQNIFIRVLGRLMPKLLIELGYKLYRIK
jgi:glycosyltransferase involved in cell wall biosynthesis